MLDRACRTTWLLAVAAATLLAVSATPAQAAQPATATKQAISQEIASQRSYLKNLSGQESAAVEELDDLDQQLSLLESEQARNALYRATLEAERDKLDAQARTLEADAESLRARLRKRLRHLYTAMWQPDLAITGRPESAADFERTRFWWRRIHARDRELLESLSGLATQKAQLSQSLSERTVLLDASRAAYQAVEEQLRARRFERDQAILQIRGRKQEARRYLAFLEQSARELARKMSGMASSGATGIVQQRGKLPLPAAGAKAAIPFGAPVDPAGFVRSRGLYLDTPLESEVRAIYSGTVVFAGWFRGYGQLVIIDHGGGYHSLYAFLSGPLPAAGTPVEQGFTVGRPGTLAATGRPGTYVELRFKGTAIDPARWFAR